MRSIVAIIALSLVACDSDPPRKPPPVKAPPPVAVDWSRPIPATTPVGEPGFVGAVECRACHEKLCDSYAHHGMARTGLRALAGLDHAWLAKLFDGAAPVELAGFRYRPLREGDRFFVEETQPDGHTWKQPVTHALGSGDAGIAFYTRIGDRYFQIPLDWFPRPKSWGVDPGFTQTNLRFTFALDGTCIACHTDPPRRSPTAHEVFVDPMPAGVGCERCHGPGAKHAASQKREDIINPARLTAVQQIEVCAQCHQDTASVYLPGKQPFGYRAGDPLDGFRRNHLREPAEVDRVILLEHPDRMTRSACFVKSAGKLTCTTCHDPHVSSRGQPAAHWRERCNQCHGTKDPCTETKVARAKNGDDCVACHMRRGPTADIASVDVVDHWIQTRPPPVKPGPQQKPERIVTWAAHLGASEPTTEEAATLAVAYDRDDHPDEAEQQARAAIGAGSHVAEVYDLVASRLASHHRLDEAARMLARALAFDPDRRRTLLSYAMASLDAGNPAEAEHALDRMIALDAGDQRALEVKGMLLVRDGRRTEGKALLQRAAAAGPAGGAAHVGLAALALQAHDRDAARTELEAARAVQPRDPWILDHLGLPHDPMPPTPASAWLPPDLRNP